MGIETQTSDPEPLAALPSSPLAPLVWTVWSQASWDSHCGTEASGQAAGGLLFSPSCMSPLSTLRRPADSEGLPCAPPTSEAACLKSAVEPAGSRPARRPGFPSHCGTLLIAQGHLQQCHLAGRDSLLFVLSSSAFTCTWTNSRTQGSCCPLSQLPACTQWPLDGL